MNSLAQLTQLLSSQEIRDKAPTVPPLDRRSFQHVHVRGIVALRRDGELVTFDRCQAPYWRMEDGQYPDIEQQDESFSGYLPDGRYLVRAYDEHPPKGTKAEIRNYYWTRSDCIWAGDLTKLLEQTFLVK